MLIQSELDSGSTVFSLHSVLPCWSGGNNDWLLGNNNWLLAGTSSYQAAWYLDDDLEEDDDVSGEDEDMDMGDAVGMAGEVR